MEKSMAKTRQNKPRKPRQRPNKPGAWSESTYVQDLLALEKSGSLSPGLQLCDIYHDDWCALIAGTGPCNCNPDIVMRSYEEIKDNPEALVRMAQLLGLKNMDPLA